MDISIVDGTDTRWSHYYSSHARPMRLGPRDLVQPCDGNIRLQSFTKGLYVYTEVRWDAFRSPNRP